MYKVPRARGWYLILPWWISSKGSATVVTNIFWPREQLPRFSLSKIKFTIFSLTSDPFLTSPTFSQFLVPPDQTPDVSHALPFLLPAVTDLTRPPPSHQELFSSLQLISRPSLEPPKPPVDEPLGSMTLLFFLSTVYPPHCSRKAAAPNCETISHISVF